METPDFNKLVNDVTSEKESFNNGLSKALYKPLSVRAIRRIESKLNIKTGNTESTTDSREEATSDIRNLTAFAAANHLMIPLVNHKIILNADATQFQIGGKTRKKE